MHSTIESYQWIYFWNSEWISKRVIYECYLSRHCRRTSTWARTGTAACRFHWWLIWLLIWCSFGRQNIFFFVSPWLMKCWMCRLPQNSKRRGWYQMVLIYKGLASNHRNTKVYTVVYHITTCITEITNYIKHFKSKKCILLITHQFRMLNFLLLLLLTVITLRSQFRNVLTCTDIQ